MSSDRNIVDLQLLSTMGQTLSEPLTAKESAFLRNSQLMVGSSCMQGWRVAMEDAHTHILSLPNDPDVAFFAVYDGHGGARVAQYAGRNLHRIICERPEYLEGDIKGAMQQGFLEIDRQMLDHPNLRDDMAGSTAIVCLIKNNILYVANAGDSRAIACINGRVESLSYDHKPQNQGEAERITAAGGFIENNRVNSNLALSRALGDFIFKKNESKPPEEQIVTAYPDVQTRSITSDWEFLVIACDGIWDVLDNVEVCDFVRTRIGGGMEPEDICEDLMNRCLAPDQTMGGLGCDNMTVILVIFLHGQSYKELCAKCASTQLDTDN